MHELGILATPDAMDDFRQIADQYSKHINATIYTYDDTKDIVSLVKEHDHEVDLWLVMGRYPYKILRKHSPTEKEILFMIKSPACFSYSIFMLSKKINKIPDKISCDSPYDYIEEYLGDLGIQAEITDIQDPDERYQFHYQLWKNKQIEGVLTSYIVTYRRLRAAKVPATHIVPTKFGIKETFEDLVKKIEFRQTQHCVIKIGQVEQQNDFISIVTRNEMWQSKNAQILKELCKDLNSEADSSHSGVYTIRSKRGTVSLNRVKIREVLDQIKRNTDLKTVIGVGYGYEVNGAEDRAEKALQHSLKRKISYYMDLDNQLNKFNFTFPQYTYQASNLSFFEKVKKLFF